jgi:large subunit ribosomal protein L10
MSKKIKQLQMDALGKQFSGVRDMVVLTSSGVDCLTENKMRLELRKKNIRMSMVKNSLARQVFTKLGITLGEVWTGPTTIAWGANSIAELSRTLDEMFKKNDKVKDKIKFKAAVAEGQEVPFAKALTMPTRQEAIGQVLAAILGPGATIAAQLAGPASQIASQIKTISEKPAEEAPAAAAAPTA